MVGLHIGDKCNPLFNQHAFKDIQLTVTSEFALIVQILFLFKPVVNTNTAPLPFIYILYIYIYIIYIIYYHYNIYYILYKGQSPYSPSQLCSK